VFPFHLWVPDVYQGSPTPVTALMATGTKAAAFAFLIQLAGILPAGASATVAAIALLTMLAGNLGALAQDDVKRMLAYSGIAHAGTLLLVLAGALALRGQPGADAVEAGAAATRAALFYMAAYVVTATGAFGVLALLESDGARFTKLSGLRGLAHTRPGLAAALSLFMLSLGGIPATGGFLGKWFVFAVLVEARMIGVAVIGAVLSVIALAYYLRVIVALWMQPAADGQAPPMTARLSASAATAFCAAGVLVLGVLPGWILGLLR
jgi:NADH-quinone oxidoreductase subunit N